MAKGRKKWLWGKGENGVHIRDVEYLSVLLISEISQWPNESQTFTKYRLCLKDQKESQTEKCISSCQNL